MPEYKITYVGLFAPGGGRDATHGHVLHVEGDGQEKRVRVDMTGSAFAMAKHRLSNPMAVLLARSLTDIESGLRGGTLRPRLLDDRSLFANEVADLEGFGQEPRRCSWQSGTSSGLRCGAASDAKVVHTTLAACEECVVPDERWICMHFVHP
jgi:hypothetical protein